MICYLEVSFCCWHSHFRDTWRKQSGFFILVVVGTDGTKGCNQLFGVRCSILSFLHATFKKPCLEEKFIFHTGAGDPFEMELSSCCHGNIGFHVPAFYNVYFSESDCKCFIHWWQCVVLASRKQISQMTSIVPINFVFWFFIEA